MLPPRHLILIGLRGSGKSTIGRLLSVRLRLPLIDLDSVTPALLGVPDVATAFARLGEQAFREGEGRALHRVLNREPSVIALGGGTPTAPGAADALREARDGSRALIVYLRALPALLNARLFTADNKQRPPLTTLGTLAEIERLYAMRDPLYRELSTMVIELDKATSETPEGCADAIIQSIVVT